MRTQGTSDSCERDCSKNWTYILCRSQMCTQQRTPASFGPNEIAKRSCWDLYLWTKKCQNESRSENWLNVLFHFLICKGRSILVMFRRLLSVIQVCEDAGVLVNGIHIAGAVLTIFISLFLPVVQTWCVLHHISSIWKAERDEHQ